jgi:hypothetical protein
MWLRCCLLLIFGGLLAGRCFAQNDEVAPPVRPAIDFYRWQEDWSVLADPHVPRQFGDALKYIPFSGRDPKRYLSFGVTMRERFVSSDAPLFGTADDTHLEYLLHRLEVHADAHLTDRTRVFVQLENALAPGLKNPNSASANKLDLRLAFFSTSMNVGAGVLTLDVGRQEIAFDLQRFVSVRDGANVRQAYDAIWTEYARGNWRFTGFISQPVQYRNQMDFDDYSNRHLTLSGVRAQRLLSSHSELSVSFSDYRHDDVHFISASGNEERQSVDVHYSGSLGMFDWDVEGMKQGGSVGSKDVDAWAFGWLSGYTFSSAEWTPRIGVQWDAASGDHRLNSGTIGTFNPLFPNGYYLTSSGYTGYTNFIHFKPSLTVMPQDNFKVVASFGMLWRETTQDAVYTQPNIPVAGTPGEPGRRTATYGELQFKWNATRSIALSLEADRYFIATVLRRAGGHDSDYLGVDVSWGW